MLDGDTCRLKGHGEAVDRRCRCDDCYGRFAVAAVESLHKVGLLGLGGETGGGTAALNVDNHQRKLGDNRQADTLALQCQTGA